MFLKKLLKRFQGRANFLQAQSSFSGVGVFHRFPVSDFWYSSTVYLVFTYYFSQLLLILPYCYEVFFNLHLDLGDMLYNETYNAYLHQKLKSNDSRNKRYSEKTLLGFSMTIWNF